MLEMVSTVIAFIGSTVAGLWDLKTTEIPDWIPHSMIILGLLIAGIESFINWDYWYILNSVIVGVCLLGFGFLMYYFGQWGGGDAKILSAVGFLIPTAPFPSYLMFPFPVSFLFNVFFIGAGYMLLYALVFALMRRTIVSKFLKDMKGSQRVLSIGSIVLFVSFLSLNWFFSVNFSNEFNLFSIISNSILLLAVTISLFVIYKFSKTVEDFGFKMKIPVKKLKVGDVLLNSKVFEGITEKELKKIRKSGERYVWVKEGVRFGLAFPLALLFTLFFGDTILFLIKVLI
jgi:prepilin signal peptidase PulO-like enzyme (type II secretory pathway)